MYLKSLRVDRIYINNEVDEFLSIIAIGQKIINSKNDYLKDMRINITND